MRPHRAGAGLIVRHAEPVMGTIVSFDLRPQGLPFTRTRQALRDACARLQEADRVFSLYRPDSPLQQIRDRRLAMHQAPPEICEVLALCDHARTLSDGAFDPWALPGGVDPTGLVKGWAAERAAQVLQSAGVGAAMVNAAGDIASFGRPDCDRAWRVGIRTPEAADRLVCVAEPEAAVATSAQYERAGHIIHPSTGCPADAARSATVCGPSLAIADALATGLIVVGAAGLRSVTLAGYDALLIDATGRIIATPSFPLAGDTAGAPSVGRSPTSTAAADRLVRRGPSDP